MMAAMKPTPQQPDHNADPFQRRQAWWPAVARMAHRMQWMVWMLAWFGGLDRRGSFARRVARDLGALEHGVRCLLLLMRRRAGDMSFVTRPSHTRAPLETQDPIRKPARFSLTLSAFDPADHGAPHSAHTFPDTPQSAVLESTPDHRPEATQPRVRFAHRTRLGERLSALMDVLANPQPHAVRMARALRRAGLGVRALITRPRNTPAKCLNPPCSKGAVRAIPILDSS